MRLIWIPMICAIALPSAAAHAGVSIGNGNYFTSFTDLEFPESIDSDLRLNRTYNSRAQFRGMFGYGWGNDFDTYLIPSADGSVIIQEGGGGAKTRFQRSNVDKIELEILVRQIEETKAAKVSGNRSFDKVEYHERLMKDPEYRDDEARELGVMRELPEGTVFYSSTRGKQSVKKLRAGYVRDNGAGTLEYYEYKGNAYDLGVNSSQMRKLQGIYKITKIERVVGAVITTLGYSSAGYLATVSTSDGKSITFEHDVLGSVTKATSNLGETATYEYCPSVEYSIEKECGQADLVASHDMSGAVYRYRYDSYHNLTELAYPDHGKETIEYLSGSDGLHALSVKRVTTKDGEKTDYEHWDDPASQEPHYSVTVLSTQPDGRAYRAEFEYWEKRRADGSSYLYRMVTRAGSDETETIYNECCEQKERATTNGSVTDYIYDPKVGLIKEKRTPSEITQWEYSDRFPRKIVKLSILNRASGNLQSKYSYEYDNRGYLVRAADASGRGFAITYDPQHRIQIVEDNQQNKLSFEYGKSPSKPARIAMEGLGSISITYDSEGNIQDVKAETTDPEKPSSSVAIKIASTFQLLMGLVSAVGASP